MDRRVAVFALAALLTPVAVAAEPFPGDTHVIWAHHERAWVIASVVSDANADDVPDVITARTPRNQPFFQCAFPPGNPAPRLNGVLDQLMVPQGRARGPRRDHR